MTASIKLSVGDCASAADDCSRKIIKAVKVGRKRVLSLQKLKVNKRRLPCEMIYRTIIVTCLIFYFRDRNMKNRIAPQFKIQLRIVCFCALKCRTTAGVFSGTKIRQRFLPHFFGFLFDENTPVITDDYHKGL